jgi:hypothetical protein
MLVPAVNRYGESNVESFEKYYARWPASLQNFPECVVKNWVYRHWQQFDNL